MPERLTPSPLLSQCRGRWEQLSGWSRECAGRLLGRPALRSAGTLQRLGGEARVLCGQADALLARRRRASALQGPVAEVVPVHAAHPAKGV